MKLQIKKTRQQIMAAVFVASATFPSMAEAQELLAFETENGMCTDAETKRLDSSFIGSSIVVQPTDLLSSGGRSSKATGADLPAMTAVACHEYSGKNVLVSAKAKRGKYCGWVNEKDLLSQNFLRVLKENSASSVVLGGSASSGICSTSLFPMSMSAYCTVRDAEGAADFNCDNVPGVRNSIISAKFLFWNINLSAKEIENTPIAVPILQQAGGRQLGTRSVKIYTTAFIYDLKVVDDRVYYLVGTGPQNIYGWVDAENGEVWFSRLATFFSGNSKGRVLTKEPGPRIDEKDVIGLAPANLSVRLAQNKSFQQFPVLHDNREKTKGVGRNWRPHLRIGYIGRLCRKGQLCSTEQDTSSARIRDILGKSDTLFLIDGTKSMRSYYPVVADAVKDVVVTEKGSSPDYRFGVAIYGDFNSRKKKAIGDPMQYKVEIPIGSLRRGTEFDRLRDIDLFIQDKAGGYSEAAYAALYKAVTETKWRSQYPKFIIHVADHGDRGAPPQKLIQALKSKQILYMPIAVRGNFKNKFNRDFVTQTNAILKRNVAEKGGILGLPKTLTTYDPKNPGTGAEADAARIRETLRGTVSLDDIVLAESLAKTLNDTTVLDTALAGLPSGFLALTETARSIFDFEAVPDKSIENMTLAAAGYVETVAVGESEPDWTYSVALEPRAIGILRGEFRNLCNDLNFSNDAPETFANALKTIISELTGDKFSDSDTENVRFRAYFDDRDNIPLTSRTILGEHLIDLFKRIGSTVGGDVRKELQKEACRTFTLLDLISAQEKVGKPYDKEQGGDLEWDEEDRFYFPDNIKTHDWRTNDGFESILIYLPLHYLPAKPEDILKRRE